MNRAAVRLLQNSLIGEGFAPGEVDGKLGSATYAAVTEALLAHREKLPGDWQEWSGARQSIAYIQVLCANRAIETGPIDGYWGPQTDSAYRSLAHLIRYGQLPRPWRDFDQPPVNPNTWPVQNQQEMHGFYGETGANQVRLMLPYPHRLAWDLRQSVLSFSCHAKVHDSVLRALTRVVDHYGMERIKELRLDRWGGCLSVRKMRGGSRWSMHSWGVALDYDPDRNRLEWGRGRAAFAQPEYEPWWRCWEEEGWVSLGRSRNFDWMHVQAARL
ncbi:MAG: M15 family peptidase [Desulfopila sp.]